jgi:hypothetical protein
MLKIVIDYFINQWDIVSKAPAILIVTYIISFTLGLYLNSWIQKNRIETNEERIKLKDEEIKRKDYEIQQLMEKAIIGKDVSGKANNLELKEMDIKALEAISRFESANSNQPNQLPVEYSVENLEADLGIDYGTADEILKRLRRLGLFESIWDNVLTFSNFNRPINEVRPGRLSKTGKDFLESHRASKQNNQSDAT